MLKLRRKSRFRQNHGRQSYYGQPIRRKISPVWLILSIPLVIVILELLAQLFLGITGKRNLMGNQSSLSLAYQPQFLTAQEKPIEGLARLGHLKLVREPRLGYQLLGSQSNNFVTINAQGFREKDAIALAKPQNEIRIFILGSSTAFGQGATSNATTIAQQLENRLQQRVNQQKQAPEQFRPDWFPFFPPTRQKLSQMSAKIREGNYRVINAAVPGYGVSNILGQLSTTILPYHPDLIILLTGYDDLMLPSPTTQADIPHLDQFLADAPHHLRVTVSQWVSSWLSHSGIATLFAGLRGSQPVPLEQSSLVLNVESQPLQSFLPRDDAELNKRRDRFLAQQQQLLQLTIQARVPVILALQPEITALNPEKLTSGAQKLRDRLGKTYLEQVPKAYPKLIAVSQQLAKAYPQAIKVVNFYEPTLQISTPIFTDAVNLTEKAQAHIADKLFSTLSQWEIMQIIPENYHLKPN